MSGPVNGEDVHGSYGEPGHPLPTGPGDSAAPFGDLLYQGTTVEEATRLPAAIPPTAPLAPQSAESLVPSCEPTIELRRGVPAHVGTRPPTYPPYPLGRPSLRDGDPFAALAPVVRLDGSQFGRLTVRAASVRGDSHSWEGGCRQDAMVVTRIGPPEAELLLLAVADGVGSARYSHVGSDRISQVAAMHLDREAENIHAALGARDASELRALASRAVFLAAAELRNQWAASPRHQSRPYADADYATTLHVLLIPTDPGIRDRVLFSVGDGGLFVLRDGHWENGNPDDSEGLLDTRTEALPHAYRSVKATLLHTVPGEVLLLGTDGITNPLTQKDPEFACRLADAWGEPKAPSLSDFLWQAQTRAKSYDDDRTVICVWEEGV
ncbi:protein phosphatase 2C domain-containing protein [Streptomyces mirabilis]|uniref:protein phosphatase 2C domain-containing protein n=1 Tax=Streptomyces mirabilis TaxID=68239 RepID=UPI003690A413